MPELPEVETMRRDLQKVARGTAITDVEVLDEKVVVGEPDVFIEGLVGKMITDFDRRGKVLILRLNDGHALLGHPRMTGRFFGLKSTDALSRFARVAIHLDNNKRIVFDDIRRFGRLEVVSQAALDEAELLRNIGADALACEPGHVVQALRKRTIPVKVALLDQKIIAGIGNIYASEILFRCGLDPRTPSYRVTPDEAAAIACETANVLAEGVKYRGTTISDYRTMDGARGNYQDRLMVYGREGGTCLREGCDGIIQKIALAGRSTYYCNKCQRKGRNRK